MTIGTINVFFWLSIGICLPLAALVLYLWSVKVYKPLKASIERERSVDLHSVSMKTLVMMMPGIIGAILCCVPMFYCGNLRKQHAYCVEVVRVNKGITRDDPDIIERCGRYDFDELQAESLR